MDESEFLVDSMYEMDAPRCVDFNLTDVSVNESLFDRKTVGENSTASLASQLDKMGFRSPGNVLRDIGNITPRVLRSASKGKSSPLAISANTPVNASPLLLDNSRRVTRSISKSAMNSTLTPTQLQQAPPVSPATHAPPTVLDLSPAVNIPKESAHQASDEEPYPQPKSYPVKRRSSISSPLVQKYSSKVADHTNTSKPNSPICNQGLKPGNKMKATRASTGNLNQKPAASDPKSVRRSVGARVSPHKIRPLSVRRSSGASPKQTEKLKRTSSTTRPLRPAHCGTPFKGKKSPLKPLRTRTRSQNAASAADSSAASKASYTSIRQRTSSAGAPAVSALHGSGPTPKLRSRAASQSSLPAREEHSSVSSLRNPARSVSPSLSRLMRPTAAVKAKMHENSNISPTKRRHSEQDESKPPKQPRNTIPRTPNFMRFKSRQTPVKSSEELEIERVRREKEEMASLKKQNEVGLRSITSGNSARKERKPPTLPSGTSANKQHAMNTRADAQVKAKRSIYDRTSTHRRSTSSLSDKGSTPKHDVYTKPTVTVPHSPKLQTRSRERPPRIPNPQQREQQELEKMKHQQFKAVPLDKRIFEGGALGVRHKEHIALTEPLPIKFATDSRVAKHAEKNVTMKEEKPVIKYNPVPKAGPVFQPKLSHKCTTVEPFTFESKDEEIKRKRAELRQKVEEEERKLREFKANPLPPSPSPLPQRQVLPPTVPEPFQLRIDERGQTQQERFKQKIEEENARMLEATLVHAKPADVLKRQPFVPKKEPPKTTAPLNVELSSTRRAEERKEYELRKREQQAETEKLEAELRRRQEEEERRELIRQRQETIIKPAPIKHYKPLQIKLSEKALTQPRSPAFSKR